LNESKQSKRDKRLARRRSRRRPARPATYSYRVPMDKHPIRFNPSGFHGSFLWLRRLLLIIFIFAAIACIVTASFYTGKSGFGIFDLLATFLKTFSMVLLFTLGWAIIGTPYLLGLLFIEWSAVKQMQPTKSRAKKAS